MKSRPLFVLACCIGLSGGWSCASHQAASSSPQPQARAAAAEAKAKKLQDEADAKAAKEAADRARKTGYVALVNAGARYVVINYPAGVVPKPGQRLEVYRDGLKVGEVKVSGPERDNNTVADILAGEVRNHDQTREE